MKEYKVIFDGEEQDEVFDTYEDAEYYVRELIAAYHEGGEILELSNPGDYPYDHSVEPEYEIIEV